MKKPPVQMSLFSVTLEEHARRCGEIMRGCRVGGSDDAPIVTFYCATCHNWTDLHTIDYHPTKDKRSNT